MRVYVGTEAKLCRIEGSERDKVGGKSELQSGGVCAKRNKRGLGCGGARL